MSCFEKVICEATGGNVVDEALIAQLHALYVAFDVYGTCGLGADHWVEDPLDGSAVAYKLRHGKSLAWASK